MTQSQVSTLNLNGLLRTVALVALFVLNSSQDVLAEQRATTAYAFLFGSETVDVGRIVIQRESPWRLPQERVTEQMFSAGKADNGDASATIADPRLVEDFLTQLRNTSASADCYNVNFNAHTIPVSWAIFFYKDARVRNKEGALYITKDGLCASNGAALYFVYPELAVYLQRTFSFMNF